MVSKALGEIGVATQEAVLPGMGGRACEAVGESWVPVGAQGKGSLLSPLLPSGTVDGDQSINRQDLPMGSHRWFKPRGQQ